MLRLLRLFLLLLIALPLLAACSSDKTEEAPPERPAQDLFEEGKKALDEDHYQVAWKAFDEVERQHPYSDLAPKAKLLSAFAHYSNEDYDAAIIGFDQFMQLHPSSEDAPYALYLKGLCYYEQISDVSRDQEITRRAMEALQLVVTRYPASTYAREATLRLDLTRDHLAGKEMNIGRWYQGQQQYQAAINRYRTVVDQYQTTSHVPEALHRLIESYTALGLKEEARQTALVLGQNYPGSPWYQDSYALIGNDPQAVPAEQNRPGWLGRAIGHIF